MEDCEQMLQTPRYNTQKYRDWKSKLNYKQNTCLHFTIQSIAMIVFTLINVSNRVFPQWLQLLRSLSQCLRAIVVSCSFFDLPSRFSSQCYLQNTPSTLELAHEDQSTCHLSKQASALIAATLSWSILTNYGATWFTFVLHRAPQYIHTCILLYTMA